MIFIKSINYTIYIYSLIAVIYSITDIITQFIVLELNLVCTLAMTLIWTRDISKLIKYFIYQRISRVLICLFFVLHWRSSFFIFIIFLKFGLFPFHKYIYFLLRRLENISLCVIILYQKIPGIVILYFLVERNNLEFYYLMILLSYMIFIKSCLTIFIEFNNIFIVSSFFYSYILIFLGTINPILIIYIFIFYRILSLPLIIFNWFKIHSYLLKIYYIIYLSGVPLGFIFIWKLYAIMLFSSRILLLLNILLFLLIITAIYYYMSTIICS